MKLTKPNTWRDLIACGEYLIDNKYTSPARLAGEGTSAGGITIGRPITEQPVLSRQSTRLDSPTCCGPSLRRSARPNIPEFGSVRRPDGLKGLYAMSPYHHVKNGVRYPACAAYRRHQRVRSESQIIRSCEHKRYLRPRPRVPSLKF